MFLSRAFKVLLIAIVAFAFVSAAYAFDAKNTFGDPDEAGRAGEGSGGISGYDITNVTYTLDESFPANIIAVSFDLAPDTATTV
ncbi:MAG: hypothetical protein Q7U34_09680, partial [Anaerolineales bacterium]|nr:hypothetical protein [Anaerolineales bacterium]